MPNTRSWNSEIIFSRHSPFIRDLGFWPFYYSFYCKGGKTTHHKSVKSGLNATKLFGRRLICLTAPLSVVRGQVEELLERLQDLLAFDPYSEAVAH